MPTFSTQCLEGNHDDCAGGALKGAPGCGGFGSTRVDCECPCDHIKARSRGLLQHVPRKAGEQPVPKFNLEERMNAAMAYTRQADILDAEILALGEQQGIKRKEKIRVLDELRHLFLDQ